MLGLPIDPVFAELPPDKTTLRRKLQLDPDLPVILLVGGGDGTGGLAMSVQAIVEAKLPVQLLVVTGRNKSLYIQLSEKCKGLSLPIMLLEFVKNMPELMHASDIIVTKAGPSTICEAIACHLPIVLSGYVPGQEAGNVKYVVDNGIGTLATTPSELINILQRLLAADSQEFREQREQTKQLINPGASLAIAEFILHALPQQSKSALWNAMKRRTFRQYFSERRLKMLQYFS
jgi:1,2-diacylglycerol 3-beta-galactosyltransferase